MLKLQGILTRHTNEECGKSNATCGLISLAGSHLQLAFELQQFPFQPHHERRAWKSAIRGNRSSWRLRDIARLHPAADEAADGRGKRVDHPPAIPVRRCATSRPDVAAGPDTGKAHTAA